MERNNNRKIIIGAVILVALLAVFGSLYYINRAKPQAGSKNIVIEVTAGSGDTTDYKLGTDAEYLRDAMDELVSNGSGFSYSGSESDYGIMVEYINGERASYTEDGAYWALYINGEYGQYSADAQPVADGETYSWIYEKAQQ